MENSIERYWEKRFRVRGTMDCLKMRFCFMRK